MATTAGVLRRYHEATKHSLESVTSNMHRLDWRIKPLPFKIYSDLEKIEPPDDISRLCLYSNGVLRWRPNLMGDVYGFRAAPCTGALYHIELYLATCDRKGLPAGLYHYSAHDNELRRLREGDFRRVLWDASSGFAPLRDAPLIIALTSTFWRNSWKYQARAYRHSYWDSGVILANLLALAEVDQVSASVVMGFVDRSVNQLLGVDGEQEAAVALVALSGGAPLAKAPVEVSNLDYATMPLSVRQVSYPLIVEAHAASSFASPDEVSAWRANAGYSDEKAVLREAAWLPGEEKIETVIERRRSNRQFARRPISRSDLERLLQAATASVPGDAFGPDLVQPFLVVNAVEGLAPGKYMHDLTPIENGDFRRAAAELALGQPIAAHAAINIYFMADLDALFARLGERGYRVAQMAGAIAGGRVELAATALGLGATGLTFFDDDVTAFFEPAANGRQVMYLVAAGQPN
jgi:SagB-type dehydrogenase family enzyme